MTSLKTKVLTVTARTPAKDSNSIDHRFTFNAYEMANGVVLLSYELTRDGNQFVIFASRDSVDGGGFDSVDCIEETGESFEWEAKKFRVLVELSIANFGEDDSTNKALELVNISASSYSSTTKTRT